MKGKKKAGRKKDRPCTMTKKERVKYINKPTECPKCGGKIHGSGTLKRIKRRKITPGLGLMVHFHVQCSRCGVKIDEQYLLIDAKAVR